MFEIIPHIYEVKIVEKHLDTFGHVNNATYLELYEEARWDLITEGGWGLNEIYAKKIGPVITRIDIQYKREVKNRELIKIETKVGKFLNSRVMTIEQRMINPAGKVCNTMTMEAGLFDLKERKLLEPTEEWMRALGVKGDWRELLN